MQMHSRHALFRAPSQAILEQIEDSYGDLGRWRSNLATSAVASYRTWKVKVNGNSIRQGVPLQSAGLNLVWISTPLTYLVITGSGDWITFTD